MKCYDYNQQCDYYFHQQTGETTYEKPADFVEAQGSQSYVLMCVSLLLSASLVTSRCVGLRIVLYCHAASCPFAAALDGALVAGTRAAK